MGLRWSSVKMTILGTLSLTYCQHSRTRATAPQPAYDDDLDVRPRPDRNSLFRKPASVHYMKIGEELAGDYKFGYDTGKADDGQSFREETRLPDGTVQGAYGYVDETGRQRIVKYTAGKDGFKAEGDIGPHRSPSTSSAAAPARRSAQPQAPRPEAPHREDYRPSPSHRAAYKPEAVPQRDYNEPSGGQTYRPEVPPQQVYRSPPSQQSYRSSSSQQAYRSEAAPQQVYRPETAPEQAYRPPSQQVYRPEVPPQQVYRSPPSQQSYRPEAPAYRPSSSQQAYGAPQASTRPQPPQYSSAQQYAGEPEVQRTRAPQGRAPGSSSSHQNQRHLSRYTPEPVERLQDDEPDYDYPDNDVTPRRLAPVDTSLFNYNIGTSQ